MRKRQQQQHEAKSRFYQHVVGKSPTKNQNFGLNIEKVKAVKVVKEDTHLLNPISREDFMAKSKASKFEFLLNL